MRPRAGLNPLPLSGHEPRVLNRPGRCLRSYSGSSIYEYSDSNNFKDTKLSVNDFHSMNFTTRIPCVCFWPEYFQSSAKHASVEIGLFVLG
jgi:hypothetical protein